MFRSHRLPTVRNTSLAHGRAAKRRGLRRSVPRAGLAGWLIAGLLAGAGPVAAWTLNGDAVQPNSNSLRLTWSRQNDKGSAWSDVKEPVENGFNAAFEFQLTDPQSVGGLPIGGDGLAFVIQNSSPSALGGYGDDLGFGGIPNSLAVVFHLMLNPQDYNPGFGEPIENHVSVQTGDPASSFGYTGPPSIPRTVDLSQDQIHTAVVRYVPGRMQVSLDGIVVLTVSVDLSTVLGLDAGRAYVGFTAGTGFYWQRQYVYSFLYTPLAPADSTAPVTTAGASSGGSPYTLGTAMAPAAWTNQNVAVTLAATDPDDAVGQTLYSLDGGTTWNNYAGAFTVSAEGANSIQFYSVDSHGNKESPNTVFVLIDKTPPVVSPGDVINTSWRSTDLIQTFTAQDALSGLLNPADASFTLSTSGESPNADTPVIATKSVSDAAGNTTTRVVSALVDKTPPVVVYSGNAGAYTVDQMVNITCAATDALSGVASSTCQNITGPAYSFPLGTNSFSATATDRAGNVGNGSTSLVVQVSAGSLTRLVTQFVTDPAVAQGLTDKLTAIATAVAQGNANAKAGIVGAFIHLVNAQTGKSITPQQAAILIQLVSAL